jgi:uncharacterized protein YjbJ (UPF0337 family)
MSINKDQVEGRIRQAAGKVQEAAGKAVGSTTQRAKGMLNQVAGASQAKFGDAKELVKEAIKDEEMREELDKAHHDKTRRQTDKTDRLP